VHDIQVSAGSRLGRILGIRARVPAGHPHRLQQLGIGLLAVAWPDNQVIETVETIEAVEVLDGCLQQLADAVLAAGGLLAVTADHGNAEDKIDANGQPLTAHTTNPVPLVLVSRELSGKLAPGKLGDVAPTLLELMELPLPSAMTGDMLFVRATKA